MQDFITGFLAGAGITFLISIFLYKLFSRLQKAQFEKLAQESIDIGALNSQESLENALKPFKERLVEYQQSIEAYNMKGAENTATLKNEMEHVIQATQRIEMEASNLTKALKGDVKVQGNWGEMVLEKILEASGFQEGREYSAQGKGMNYKDSEGNLYRPDVVVHFPDGANIVVDSKVSLVSYEKYVSCPEEEKETCLKELRSSVRKHIEDLSGKKYHSLEGVNSPDYVMLFIPIERVFSLLLSFDQELLDFSWKKKIMIVTPLSFMATLKTVQSLWRVESQNANAKDIAKKAGLLYDKFHIFYEDLVAIQTDFSKTQERFDKSLGRLKDGKGNILGKVEELKELGADTSK